MAIVFELIVVAILAVFVLLGIKRGLVLSLCGLVGVLIAFGGAGVLARTLSPMVADALEPKFAAAIEEQLGQEQILIQKFKMYAGMTQDQQLKACCEQIASKHEIHKNKLLNLLA